MEGRFTTAILGHNVHIDGADVVRFGGGATGADIQKGTRDGTVAYDVKFARGRAYDTTDGLREQLSAVRASFQDGTLREFVYVTQGQFGAQFKAAIRTANRGIVQHWAEEHGRGEEVAAISATELPAFAREHQIRQVDYCEHVHQRVIS
jgi:hypothetical protein